ncbi:hypothetical protein [Streptomyces sp. NPDC060022]|uniref:hypothetical protein n=1 Tax=Streptomyces sp. NPDC060022 TaxID=3347039 RepID=UPI0036A52188
MTIPLSPLGVRAVTINLKYGTKEKLDALKPYFADEARRARTFSTADTSGLNLRETAARKSIWAAEKEQRRRDGQLTDSIRALVMGAAFQEVTARGWTLRDWSQIPHQSRGPWPGAPRGSWEETLTVDLPADLVAIVHAGCWNASKDAIGKLRDWRERHPKARPRRPSRPGCSAEELAEHDGYAAKVLTTGKIWRNAVKRGLAYASPHLPPQLR